MGCFLWAGNGLHVKIDEAMHNDTYKARQQLYSDLAELASRYIEHHEGRELDGFAALGEDLLKMADCTKGATSWLALLTRLQRLSG